MSSPSEFSAKRFYRFIAEGRLAAIACEDCGAAFVPPRSVCPKCFSKSLSWRELSGRGRVVSFSEVHASSDAFQHLVPYIVAVVELNHGVRLPGILRSASLKDVKIGCRVRVKVNPEFSSEGFPYHFVAEAKRSGARPDRPR